MKARKQNVALFIVPGQSMDTPSASGYYSHKFDFIYDAMARSDWELRVIVDVYTQKPFRKTKYTLYSLKLNFLIKVLEVAVRNPTRILTGEKPLTFLNQLALEKLYSQLILRSAARVVLAIGASEALVKACRTQGVRCIEMQHGMLGPDDVKLYWPSGYLPDIFLGWDSYSSQVAEQAGMGAITIGHPDVQNVISTSEKPGSYMCVSLGKNASDSEDRWGCFPKRLTQIIDSLVAADVPVLVRLHPTIASQTLTAMRLTKWIFRRFGNVRVDNPLEIPLAQSIRSSFANLTGSSATWFEFALAGKTTFVYESHWADRFRKHASASQIWGPEQSPIQLFSAESSVGIGRASRFSTNLSLLSKNFVPVDEFVLGLSPR